MRQIRLTPAGLWHRPARGDAKHTACGIPIAGAIATRDHSREGNHLCPICWTTHELDTGEMQKLEAESERDHPEMYFDESDTPTTVGDSDPDPDDP